MSMHVANPVWSSRAEFADIMRFVELFCVYNTEGRREWSFNTNKLSDVNLKFQRFANQKPFDAQHALLAGAVVVIVTSLLPNALVRVVAQVGLALVGGYAYKLWNAERVMSQEEKKLIDIFRKAAAAFRQEWQRTSDRICESLNKRPKKSDYTLYQDGRIEKVRRFAAKMVDQTPVFSALEWNSNGSLGRESFETLIRVQLVEIVIHLPDLDSTLQKEWRHALHEGSRALYGRSNFSVERPYVYCETQEGLVEYAPRKILSATPWPTEPLLPVFTPIPIINKENTNSAGSRNNWNTESFESFSSSSQTSSSSSETL